MLEENKELQVHFTQERHHKEDLEVKVLVLEKYTQLLEVENHLLSKQLGRSGD